MSNFSLVHQQCFLYSQDTRNNKSKSLLQLLRVYKKKKKKMDVACFSSPCSCVGACKIFRTHQPTTSRNGWHVTSKTWTWKSLFQSVLYAMLILNNTQWTDKEMSAHPLCDGHVFIFKGKEIFNRLYTELCSMQLHWLVMNRHFVSY